MVYDVERQNRDLRRLQYEHEVGNNPLNYDSWTGYIRLEEDSAPAPANKNRIRELYARALANVPPLCKLIWKRYVDLWIDYARYEEFVAAGGDAVERTRQAYRQCLELIHHTKFSFVKAWLHAAQFEIRQLNLEGAHKILGASIGCAPKAAIFDKYIEMELRLGNVDRCRKLYENYLDWLPRNSNNWVKYAELEKTLGEEERARGIFELAIGQPQLDKPGLLWKAYIDFERWEGEVERARQIYERLLDRTQHLKVWLSYAKFEAQGHQSKDSLVAQGREEQCVCIQRCRGVFERAVKYLDKNKLKVERLMLIKEWLIMETSFGDMGDVSLVKAKFPMNSMRRGRGLASTLPSPLPLPLRCSHQYLSRK
ncbi:hypothetical protein CerSpe_211350 [Prunus speciosa]